MRIKLAKVIRNKVISDMYGDDVPKDQKRLIRKTKNFIAIYRRAKKNYILNRNQPKPAGTRRSALISL